MAQPTRPDPGAPLIVRCPHDGRFLDKVLEHEGKSKHQQNCRHCGMDVYYTLQGMTVTEIVAVQPNRTNTRYQRQDPAPRPEARIQ